VINLQIDYSAPTKWQERIPSCGHYSISNSYPAFVAIEANDMVVKDSKRAAQRLGMTASSFNA
jgi:hypothetical protein